MTVLTFIVFLFGLVVFFTLGVAYGKDVEQRDWQQVQDTITELTDARRKQLVELNAYCILSTGALYALRCIATQNEFDPNFKLWAKKIAYDALERAK